MEVVLDDGIRPFIEEMMNKVDPDVYNQDEFNRFFNCSHKLLADIDAKGKIIAFCGIMVKDKSFKMCYTWCDSTREGIEAYGRGINYMINHYSPMEFGPGAIKINKIKRLLT
jgi:hypothetical protein